MSTTSRTIVTSVLALAAFMVLTGILYPALIWAFAVATQHNRPPVELVAPRYTDSTLFQARPSASDYSTMPASASNLGPTSAQLHTLVQMRDSAFRVRNSIGSNAPVPSDMLYSSGSGLDPHISIVAAQLQSPRVARQRGLPVSVVDSLIREHTVLPQFIGLGTPLVNVVTLNDAVARK